jgi:hypothetical protein
MQHSIRKGGVFIGTIHAELPMLGDEVIVETAFPASNPDDGDQCSSFELGVTRLEMIYEDHLEALANAPARLVAADAEEPKGSDADDDLPF